MRETKEKVWCVHIVPFIVVLLFSHVELFVTQWTVAPQAPLSMGFSR